MSKLAKIFCIVLLALVFVFVLIQGFFALVFPIKYNSFVNEYSKTYNLNPSLVYSVILAESKFNPNAKSNSGAMGLMQIMPKTGEFIALSLNEEFFEENLYNPQINIKYGCFYLRYLMNKFEDETLSLCAYNAGETVVRGWKDENENFVIVYPETQKYVKKVKQNILIYKNYYNLD